MADRDTFDEPLMPTWAAPMYYWVAAGVMVLYLGLDLIAPLAPGLAVLKTFGPGLLALFALFSGAPFLAAALVLSAVGDYMLALDPPEIQQGIMFFGAAHLAYILIFIAMIIRRGWKKDGLILAGCLALYGAAMLFWLRPGMGNIALEASIYLGVIMLMAMLAALVRGSRWVVIGACLFVISDSLIAARWFQDILTFHYPDWGGALVWITYGGAQLLLAKGIVETGKEAAVA